MHKHFLPISLLVTFMTLQSLFLSASEAESTTKADSKKLVAEHLSAVACEPSLTGVPVVLTALETLGRGSSKELVLESAELIKACVECGYSVNASHEGYSPLKRAAYLNHTQLVATLLLAKANVNAVSKKGNTPLIDAIKRGNPEAVQLLVEAKATTNYLGSTRGAKSQFFTPLQLSCRYFLGSKNATLSIDVANRNWAIIAAILADQGAKVQAGRFNPVPNTQDQHDVIELGKQLLLHSESDSEQSEEKKEKTS